MKNHTSYHLSSTSGLAEALKNQSVQIWRHTIGTDLAACGKKDVDPDEFLR
jgi:hypothetical protein